MWVFTALLAFASSGTHDLDACKSELAGCHRSFHSEPAVYESSRCFFSASRLPGCFKLAQAKLASLKQAHPSNHFLELVEGHFYWDSDPRRAESTYRSAAHAFHNDGGVEGELIARFNLIVLLQNQNRTKSELRSELDKISRLGERTTTNVARARALAMEAAYRNRWNLDLKDVYARLSQYSNQEIQELPYSVKREFLRARSNTARRLLKFEQATFDSRQLELEADEAGDLKTRTSARFFQSDTYVSELALFPHSRSIAVTGRALEIALNDTIEHQAPELFARTLLNLAEMGDLSGYATAELLSLTQLCLQQSSFEELTASTRAYCLLARSKLLQESHPSESLQDSLASVAILSGIGCVEEKLTAWTRLMRAGWGHLSIRDTLSIASVVHELLDELRYMQTDSFARRQVFAGLAQEYKWLASRFLEQQEELTHAVETAFVVQELARARVLEDTLKDRFAMDDRPASTPISVALEDAFLEPFRSSSQQLVQVNIQQVQELRDSILNFSHSRENHLKASTLSDPKILNTVQSLLGEDEALLSFSLPQKGRNDEPRSGRSSVIAVTAHGHFAATIDLDREQLLRGIAFLKGIDGRRNSATQKRVLTRLREQLLDPVTSNLSGNIDKLVVVHDGVLQSLPFFAIDDHFAYSLSPSASTWSLLRSKAVDAQNAKSLVLTDPATQAPISSASIQGCPELEDKIRSHKARRLVASRVEATLIQDKLDKNAVQLNGAHATPMRLVQAWAPSHNHLHISSHTLAANTCPDLAALLLASDSENPSGLLHVSHIQKMDLSGSLVVLGGCATARGAALRGEGVLSVARAFQMAGAHAVVASIWPIADREGATFFRYFYAHLGDGFRVDESLRHAQKEMRARGERQRAYAGFVVLGRGDYRYRESDHGASRLFKRLSSAFKAPLGL